MDDDQLGFATMEESQLVVWSRGAGPAEYMGWTQSIVIDLETLLPAHVFSQPLELLAFAHGVGVLFIAASDDLFSVDLKSKQVNKFLHGYDVYSVAPFRSFYTPDLGVASSGEGPGAGGSSA
ncbi:unnamed protein product [Urochloa humidicola]